MRRGFTLVELLVVIALIGVIVGLTVPAVQMIREAAYRAKCANNEKQWALAMHLYHDSNQKFPYGAKANPRTVWQALLWPYVEQTALASRYNYSTHLASYPNTVFLTHDGPYSIPTPIDYCPSDRPGAMQAVPYPLGDPRQDVYWRSKGNYQVCWGQFWQPDPLVFLDGETRAVFGYLDHRNRTQPQESRIADITDGTSNTLLLSEMIVVSRDDLRDHRDARNDDDGCAYFTTSMTPNTSAPDSLWAGWCVSEPGNPCVDAAGGMSPKFKAARSRHRGGVNAALADGSVRFFRDDIENAVWWALGTMNGGEP